MAFDASYTNLIQKQRAALADLDRRLQMAELRVANLAAEMSVRMMRTLASDRIIRGMMQHVTNFAGRTGAAAARQFDIQFRRQTQLTVGAVNKLNTAIKDVQNRTEIMAERMAGGFTKAAKSAKLVSDARREITEKIRLNNILAQTIRTQRNAINPNAAATPQQRAAMLNQRRQLHTRIVQLQQENGELQATADNARLLAGRVRRLEIQERMMDFKDKAMAPIQKVKDGASTVAGIGRELLNPKMLGMMIGAGIAMALFAVFTKFTEGLRQFREAGYTGRQSFQQERVATNFIAKKQLQGYQLDAKELRATVIGLQRDLASLSIPPQLLDASVDLQTSFGLSADETSRLVGQIHRFTGRDAAKSQKTLERMNNIIRDSNANGADVMRQMAGQAAEVAKSANKSWESMTKAAIEAQRVGYNLSSVANFANNLVNDFEGALKTQAELGTMFPGMDMSEVMYASTFGSTEDVGSAIQSMIQNMGMDINNLNRPFMNALERLTGFGADELINMATGNKTLKAAPATNKDLEMSADKIISGLADPLKAIQNILNAILMKISGFTQGLLSHFFFKDQTSSDGRQEAKAAAIARKNGSSEASALQNMAAEKESWSSRAFGVLQDFSAAVSPKETKTPGLFALAPKFHDGLLPDEFPAILQQGEAVIPKSVVEKIRGQSSESNVDMKNVENLLRQLIQAVKAQKTVHMDGKAVGKVLIDAHSRI
jgi:hypothetical protein